MTRVTVVVRGEVVVIRGRDARDEIKYEEEVPLSQMSEAHVEQMRARVLQDSGP